METVLLPCPYCGSSDLTLFSMSVSCKNCMAMGPIWKEKDGDRASLWNRRTYFSSWTASYGFPHMKEVGWLFKKKVPNGWEDRGECYNSDTGKVVMCSNCMTTLHIGMEDGKSFRYCAREMIKTK